MKKLKLARMYKPYLDFYLSLGFMRIGTEVWREPVDRYEFTYISLYWQFFKWEGRFRLYKPGQDINQ